VAPGGAHSRSEGGKTQGFRRPHNFFQTLEGLIPLPQGPRLQKGGRVSCLTGTFRENRLRSRVGENRNRLLDATKLLRAQPRARLRASACRAS